MFKFKIKNKLLGLLSLLQIEVLSPVPLNANTANEKLKEIRQLKNRIALLNHRVKINLVSINKDEILVNVGCDSDFNSSDYFFDVFTYQLSKVIKNYSIMKVDITHRGYKKLYHLKSKDFQIFKFTVNNISRHLKNGTWLIDNAEQSSKYYIRQDTRAELLTTQM